MPIDFELRNELIKEIPDILRCFQCGTCVSSCPSEKYGKNYTPRRKILSATYGDKALLSEELFRCLTCHSCNERCPQEVNPYDVLVKLKNFTIKKGFAKESESIEQIYSTGSSMQFSERAKEQRKALGLLELKKIEGLNDLK
ncbi:MAG: 4Fe-4S dicluster domain-containing protein [archaeon]